MNKGDQVKWFEGNQYHYGVISNILAGIVIVINTHTEVEHQLLKSKISKL